MRKRFLSFALALLVILALPAGAFADKYCNLGQVQAGQPINCFIASLSGSGEVSADRLPTGCELVTETLNGVVHLYLRGTPAQSGSYSFQVSTGVPDELMACSVSVVPGAPSVFSSADVDCYVGDTALLTVSASAADGAALRYQWYSATAPVNSNGILIMDATAPEYRPDTGTVGTMYYYCVVSSVTGGQTMSSCSQPIRVTVSELAVSSIMVNSMPHKTRYLPGENLDPLGLTIALTMSNGEVRLIDNGYLISPTQLTNEGTQIITVSYAGKSCSFPVTVESAEANITGIGMVKLPDKTEYKAGDFLETAGLIFRAYLRDGSYQDLSTGFTCEPMILSGSGAQTVTLSYMNKTCTFTVNVAAGKQLLEVTSTPRKLSYAPGEALDTAGLVLKLTDGYDSKIISSGFTCEPTVFTGTGTQVVKVRYNDLLATFTVTVRSPAASPTVQPTATPAPGSSPDSSMAPASPTPELPAVSPTGSRSPQHEFQGRSNRGVLVVIMILAILCLIVLGAMMVVLNNGGLEAVKQRFYVWFRSRRDR